MADVWRGEVNVDDVVLVLPDPTATPVTLQALARYYFICSDPTYTYTIIVNALHHSFGAGPTKEYRTSVTCSVTQGLTVHFTQTDVAANGNAASEYQAGGVLSIEKDGIADEIRFTTPLGTVTAVPSSWGGNDNVKMSPGILGIGLALRVAVLSNHQNTVRWNNFWGAQNGVRYRGAAMSADQPGTFTAWARTVPVGGAPPHDTSFVQEETAFKSEQSANTTTAYANNLEQYESQWNAGDTIPLMIQPAIELARSDEHGLIWAAFTRSAYRDTIFWRRSADGGATWTDGEIDHTDGQVVRNPNLFWFGGDLVAVWTDGSAIFQSRSRSLGEHWTTETGPLFASLADNPRLRVVCDRHHGIVYYFVRDSAGVLTVFRSYDLGLTFDAGVTVHASIDDAILDCTITQDSRLHARFQVAGGYETWTSSSFGEYWDAEATAVGLGTNPRSTEDQRSGWTFHVNWSSINTSLFGYGDPEFGLRAANFATPAGPGLSEQIADVEVRPDGVPLIAYWAPSEVFTTRRSFDYCSSWEA